MGATAAPRVWAASSAISISGEFEARTATTSPRLTPSERRPAATPRRRASSADQERSCHLPEGLRERTAARDGSTAARAAISCGTLWKGTSGRGGPTISRPSIGGTLLPGTPYAIRRYFFAAACFSRNSLIICSCVARGTGWYLANSIEYSPLPWVAERRSVEYPNISDSGTCALAIR